MTAVAAMRSTSELGHGAERPAQPVRSLGGTTQSAGGRLGVDEGRGSMRRGPQGGRDALRSS